MDYDNSSGIRKSIEFLKYTDEDYQGARWNCVPLLNWQENCLFISVWTWCLSFVGYKIKVAHMKSQLYKQTREDTSVRKQIVALLFSAQQIHGNAAV